jgi:MoaA/NifB/PqqE/SkfB family radical SAM enzyme
MTIVLNYVSQIANYNLGYHFGIGKPLPDNITISITRACQSNCLTCDCGSDTRRGLVRLKDELSLAEWMKIVEKIDWELSFLTISGGEPFLSRNLEEVAIAFAEQTRPKFVTIPTNALAPSLVLDKVKRILERTSEQTIWHVNASVDGIGAVHDRIRGVEGNFTKSLGTISSLLELRERHPNLRVGVHTVVSTYNVDKICETVRFFKRLPVDNHISEIAEERYELGTVGRPITPYDSYSKVIPFLKEALGVRGEGKLRRSLREAYYDFVGRWVKDPKRQHVPCMAGVASCHITEEGKLVSCCTRWVKQGLMGNMREYDYDLKKAWFSPEANSVRQSIKQQECACPLASAAYSSLLMSPRSLLRITRNLL